MDINNSKNTNSLEHMKWKLPNQKSSNIVLKDDITADIKKLKAENTRLRQEKRDLTDKVTDQETQLKQYKKKYETVNSDYVESKRLCESQREALAALKENKCEMQQKHKKELVSLTNSHEKYVAKLKKEHNLKTQQLIDENETLQKTKEKLKQDVQNNFKEFAETIKNTQETADKKIKAKDDTIKELRDTIEKLKDEITQINDQKKKEIHFVEKRQVWQVAARTETLKHKIVGLDAQILALQKKVSFKDKTIEKLTKDNQFQAQTISEKDEEIKDYKMTRKTLHQRLMERQTQCTLMDTKLRNTLEITQTLEQKITKLQEAEKKLKSELQDSKVGCVDLREKVENQKYRLQQYEPMLKELKEEIRALDRRDRDYKAGLEGCRSVLYEPKKLQEKVTALILFYLEEKKVEVDKYHEHILELHNSKLKGDERYERIIQAKDRTIKQLKTANKDAEERSLAEHQVIVHHLNEYTQKSKKKTGH